jgi:hypothetical protein
MDLHVISISTSIRTRFAFLMPNISLDSKDGVLLLVMVFTLGHKPTLSVRVTAPFQFRNPSNYPPNNQYQ